MATSGRIYHYLANYIWIWLAYDFCCYGDVWYVCKQKKTQTEKTQTKKTASSKKLQNGVFVAVEDIEKLCLSNDIIEIKIIVQGKETLIGSASDCKTSDFNFFDKRYYVEDDEFVEFDLFQEELKKLISSDKVLVFEIDGLKRKTDIEYILKKAK